MKPLRDLQEARFTRRMLIQYVHRYLAKEVINDCKLSTQVKNTILRRSLKTLMRCHVPFYVELNFLNGRASKRISDQFTVWQVYPSCYALLHFYLSFQQVYV